MIVEAVVVVVEGVVVGLDVVVVAGWGHLNNNRASCSAFSAWSNSSFKVNGPIAGLIAISGSASSSYSTSAKSLSIAGLDSYNQNFMKLTLDKLN